MMLMMQNLGSKPKTSCSTTTEVVIINGFLYVRINFFILAAATARSAAG
ncbi:MAG: hypothetical protein K0R65_2485 [Crocinitomicaceae bacterium]|jgi:hypothetical protein|nr:hypothetical protein [Crocinitomicaceae bacterium]